jgi:hypothetical protein
MHFPNRLQFRVWKAMKCWFEFSRVGTRVYFILYYEIQKISEKEWVMLLVRGAAVWFVCSLFALDYFFFYP